MTAQESISHEMVTFADLKVLASATGPCITVVVRLSTPNQVRARLKNAVRDLERALLGRGADKSDVAHLVEPIEALATQVETDGVWAHALILFRSRDLFRYFWLHDRVQESITFGQRFQVRPLLSILSREQRFDLLALSQRRTRLLRCTDHRADETSIRGVAPESFAEWVALHTPDNATDRDHEQRYLTLFLKDVEKGVHTILRSDQAPLILVGVEAEVTIYRKVNTYSRLLQHSVDGSPDGLPSRRLHPRAAEIAQQTMSEPLQVALTHLKNNMDRQRVATSTQSAICAARQGRVLDLILAEDAQSWGIWDDEEHDVGGSRCQEDLLNAVALETVRHGGRAFVVSPFKLPIESGVAASLRY
jgi:hypothetical protein